MIALASDHSGLELKGVIKKLLEEMALPYTDFGADSAESTDYALYGYPAAQAVASGRCDRGIVICGTGNGMALTVNKVKGIRCVLCSDCYTARLSRQHNDANMIALGARVVGTELARMIVQLWLTTAFEGGRHQRRIDQIRRIEEGLPPV